LGAGAIFALVGAGLSLIRGTVSPPGGVSCGCMGAFRPLPGERILLETVDPSQEHLHHDGSRHQAGGGAAMTDALNKEREAILKAARQRGIEPGSPNHVMLELWLSQKPATTLLEAHLPL
jgi:hypothetical protein